ncbi:MAG: di-trans,poly-cis-decaprenylcistransferase, partial [Leptospira sp.]|nr:di-trans,poly-cis-decaprenylcistransferase [Leptospira sp.]
AIFDLLNTYIETKLEKIKKNGVRIIHSGARKKIPAFSMKNIDHAIHETRKNKQITLNFCLNYGSHDEIINAVNRILQSRKEKKIQVYSEIKKKELQSNLYTGQLPPVDLLIRTGGEHRLSNFLLWQSAYAEIYFTDILWPDFNRDTLFLALSWYQKRIRKFGGL